MSKENVNKLQSREAMVEVTSTVLGKEKSTGKRIMVRPFVTSTASVSVKYGMTINLGDYESARVDVMITSPCYKEEIVPVYRQTRDLAENLIQREIDKITTTLKDG